MRINKKLLSGVFVSMLCVGSFVAAHAADISYNITLKPVGVNTTVITGTKEDANDNFSMISLTGGEADHLYAWVDNAKGKMVSQKKYLVEKGDNVKLAYKDGMSVAQGAPISIEAEHGVWGNRTASGVANLY